MASPNPPVAVSCFAPAKINLYLHLTGRRDDGLHTLDSLVVFADVGDVITVDALPTPSDRQGSGLRLTITGPFAAGLDNGPDNLVLRAAHVLAQHAGIRPCAHITLEKNLPLSSGIGGGSSDGAATLKALSAFWHLEPPPPLETLGLKLGADVPVCLRARPAQMSGIGEHLSAAPVLPPSWLVLVNRGIGVSTPAVFQRYRDSGQAFCAPAALSSPPKNTQQLADAMAARHNDLMVPALALSPEIQTVLDSLNRQNGVLLARMSGSGGTCFGLFASQDTAHSALQHLRHEHPDWWVIATKMLENPPISSPTPRRKTAP